MTDQVRLAFVVAAAENGVIGRDGRLPWRLPTDLKQFRKLTLGKPVIMGRKTYDSIGKPLDGRDNIVLTRRTDFAPPGVHVVSTPEAAVALARQLALQRGADEVAVIGGAEVYRATLPYTGRIYLTLVHARPEGDTLFTFDPELWTEIERQTMPRGQTDQYAADFLVLDRKS